MKITEEDEVQMHCDIAKVFADYCGIEDIAEYGILSDKLWSLTDDIIQLLGEFE